MPVRIIRSEIESETHRGLSVSGILPEAGGGKHRIDLLGALLRRRLEEGACRENHGRAGVARRVLGTFGSLPERTDWPREQG